MVPSKSCWISCFDKTMGSFFWFFGRLTLDVGSWSKMLVYANLIAERNSMFDEEDLLYI